MEASEKPTVQWNFERKVNQKFNGLSTSQVSLELVEEPVLLVHKEAAGKTGTSEDSFRPANENWNTKGKMVTLWPSQSDG